MRITIDIPENQVEKVLAYLKNLNGVTIHSQENDKDIADWQIEVANERLEDYQSNPNDLIEFDKAMDDLDKKL